ncbi:AMP-dependent synthetase and ligase [Actinobacteria bacterium OK074]|nr:AMP-dependent synthetase and ligase [Actinobacteria bacterium OK074]
MKTVSARVPVRTGPRTFRAMTTGGRSVAEGLLQASACVGLTVLDAELRPRRIGYRDLAQLAEQAARSLQARGVCPGDRVCLLAQTSPHLVVTLFGIWRLGAVPVVLPSARRRDVEEFVAEVSRRVEAAESALLVTTERNAEMLVGRLASAVTSLRELRGSRTLGQAPLAMPSPDDIGLLQFPSGTTAQLRAVPVTQAQLVGTVAAVGEHVGFGPDDTYVSWLPLHHGMGIVPLAGLVAGGAEIVMMATNAFQEDPGSWMRTVSDYRATLTAAPGTAYSLAAAVQARNPAALNLSQLRLAVHVGESLETGALAATNRVFGPYGLDSAALRPMYGPTRKGPCRQGGTVAVR